jgi:hypothetical protein
MLRQSSNQAINTSFYITPISQFAQYPDIQRHELRATNSANKLSINWYKQVNARNSAADQRRSELPFRCSVRMELPRELFADIQ